MTDKNHNELKIGDRITVEFVVKDATDQGPQFPVVTVTLGDLEYYFRPSVVTRIPDEPPPYEPPLSIMAAPVRGSKPEEL